VAVVAVVSAVAVGIGLRVFILTHSLGVLDSDEAITGLMARHFLDDPGSFQVFYWGTNYGGTIEAIVTAVPFAVFGSSVLALKVTSALWHAVAAVLLWRIGRRLVGDRAGVVAALALWLWPGVYVWWSTKSRGFYGATLVFGLVLLLCALRLADNPRSVRDWLVFGAAAGLGWWTQPQILYLAVPACLWLLISNRRALRWAPLALPAFAVGALPWIVWNLRHQWQALNSPFSSNEGYVDHLHRFWGEGIPMALGLREPYLLNWIVPHGHALFVATVALGVLALVTRRRGSLLLGTALLAYPFLHALSPVAGYTGEGRYLFYFAPLMALVVGHAARNRVALAVVFALMLTVTIGQLTTMGVGIAGNDSDVAVPVEMGSLVRTLETERVDAVFADYWVAYRLTFESRERVIAAGFNTSRYAPYVTFVRHDPRPAWVHVTGSMADERLTATMSQKGIPYRTVRAGKFSIHIPARPVLPEEVLSP
jgi:4-amino-4-deoxy-L-arabinose transferase-like glycosyltransferase